ncbi:pentatricopeptide repeat-containing protein At5g66520-like [Typha latifolia]|uniref:pentatricopeptide repeat-containing protein At5g66520-like n=1 Tax=Typha latifolia TaxID=4733 RepID=UPI003C2FD93A
MQSEVNSIRMLTTASSFGRTMDLLLHPNLSISLTTFSDLFDLKRTHAHIITSGLSSDSFAVARLLASLAISISISSSHLSYAISLFSSFPHPTIFMYNTMIRAFSQTPNPVASIHYYIDMLRANVSPDRLTFPFLIRSCRVLGRSDLGRGLYGHVVKLGLDSDVFVVNNAITMYSESGDIGSARQLFDENSDVVDVVSWTAVVTGYANCGELGKARRLFDRMPEKNLVSWNSMISAYARSGKSVKARELFDRMPARDTASWGSMISGLAQSGLCKEALVVFREMIQRDVVPNEATLVSIISACAQLRALEQGDWVYSYIEENKVEMSVILATALVDMYGKCGGIGKAIEVFNKMPVKNVYSWNSMISGLAMNGCERQSLTLFWKMQLTGLQPNAITFIGLLTACSHSGLIDEGQWLFDKMIREFQLRPLPEHYGCMVDLLGRAGLVKDAVDFVGKMPVKPHPGLWGALAGACNIHGDVELGEEVAKRLIELEPHHGGRYVLLANIYAAARRWHDMAMVRKLLKERRVAKGIGNSIVES